MHYDECTSLSDYTASVSGNDFQDLSLPLSFSSGSGDGAQVCALVDIFSDNLVEGEEDFAVTLSLVTSTASLSLGNKVTVVTLTDDSGR